ncbi:MAG: glycosyltransferase family 4 protein [Xenococcaceae cyanobacterium MO_188.B32]|nr:glycosyltransferase family 4 protein [Xenococcaceae cyanobacterium MO_188.B32]
MKIKTLQIGLEWFPEQGGGLDRVYHDCTRHLPKVGVDVRGLVAGSPQVARATSGQIQAFAPANSSLLKRWLEVRKNFNWLISQEEYQLIVSHFALYTFPLLDRLKDFPLVTHFHGPWALESDVEAKKTLAIWLKKELEKICYRRSCQFIVLSQTFRDILHQEYQVPLEQINIVPGAVESERFNLNISADEARTKLGWSNDRPIIFCVRRLAKRMGLENLITAIDKVRRQYPDILLYIAGKGALASTLEQQIAELELTQHVHLLGYIADDQLPLAYRAANFSVVPTTAFEGFGLIVIESLAAGTPVLGTPIGGIPEILQPFCPDLLFESASVESIAQGISEILANRRKLPSQEACQAYIQANYTWSKIARQIKSIYLKAIE